MKKIVFTFGRFNPPTTGHHLLANKVKNEAKKRGADHKIFGSSSTDKKKNPLSPTEKFKFMKKILKGFNVAVNRKANTPFVVLKQLSDEGYEDVTMVVGADRVAEFNKQIKKYVGPKKDFKFKKFQVVSAGERDPDAEGITGMSASKMRAAAADGNFDAFRLGIPSHVSEKDAMDLFNTVRKGMGVRGKIKESSWFSYDEFIEFENELNERKFSAAEIEKRKKVGDKLPASKFKKNYNPPPRGPAKTWKDVMWATATNIVKGKKMRGEETEFESVELDEIIQDVKQKLISEEAPKMQMAKQRMIAKERERGTGVSTPKEKDAARKRGEREAAQAGGKPRWQDLMLVTDARDKVKLILAKDYNPKMHDIKVRKGKVTRGLAGSAAQESDWEWTETAKSLIPKPKEKPVEPKRAAGAAAAVPKTTAMATTPGAGPGVEATPAEKEMAKVQTELETARAKQELDAMKAEPQLQAQAEQEAEMQQRVANLKKSSKDLLYPDSEHQAVDLEAGVVSVWNEINGVNAKKGKLSDKDQKKVQDSLTLGPASRRIVEQIQEQIGPDFEAIHYGRATEPISGTWSDFGGTDNTPKTDMIFKHRKTGEEIRVSVKAGDGQLMSAKKGEAMATFKSIMQVKGDEIKAERGTAKKVNNILKKMDKFVTTASTGVGSGPVGQFLKGKTKEGEKPEILAAQELHDEVTKDLQELYESSPAFRRALTRESMTGEIKFGGCCPPSQDATAAATHMLSMRKDGTNAKLIPIDNDYVDTVAGGVKTVIKFKSSQKITSEGGKKVKKGDYSYWTAMRLLTSAAAFAGTAIETSVQSLVAHNIPFSFDEYNILLEQDETNARSYFQNAQKWIGKDPERMKQFLGVEADEISTNSVDLSDHNTIESGEYTNIVINGKRKRIPVQKDVEYYDLEKEMENNIDESFRFLTEPDILDRTTNTILKQISLKEDRVGLKNLITRVKAHKKSKKIVGQADDLRANVRKLESDQRDAKRKLETIKRKRDDVKKSPDLFKTPPKNVPSQEDLDQATFEFKRRGKEVDKTLKVLSKTERKGRNLRDYATGKRKPSTKFGRHNESVELNEDNTAAIAKQVKQAVKKHTTGKLVVRSKGGKSRFIMVRADSIDNKFRKMMLDVVAPNANVRDKSNISYGNISDRIISASVEQWMKVLGLKESVGHKESYEFKDSSIHGLGSFATENIQQGEKVALYYLDLLEDIPTMQRTDFCRLTNHSYENQNLGLEKVDGNVYTYASRDIKEGEEFFIDYFHVFKSIMPILGESGSIIEEVLRWTDGYEDLEIKKDEFSDIIYELSYFVKLGDAPELSEDFLKALPEYPVQGDELTKDLFDGTLNRDFGWELGDPPKPLELHPIKEDEDPTRRAKRQKEYNAKPEQRAKRSSVTSLRNKMIRKGTLKIGDGKDVDHKDGNPLNNSPSNIRITSIEFNRGRNNNKGKTNEEHGAGEMGTKELLKKYLKDTPHMTVDGKKSKDI